MQYIPVLWPDRQLMLVTHHYQHSPDFPTSLADGVAFMRNGRATHATALQPPKFMSPCIKLVINLATPGCCKLSGAWEVSEVCNGSGGCGWAVLKGKGRR